jgi:hypothetical protein
MSPRFPLAFRPTGVRFLSRPVPPETSAFLTVGPPPSSSGLRRGFHVPRARDAAGVGALYAPGRRCPPGRRESTARRLPPRSGLPCAPLPHPTGGGLFSRGVIEGSLVFARPAFPLPVAPGWNGNSWASPWSFAPRRCQRRTSRWRRVIGHEPGTTLSSATPPTPSPRASTHRTRPRVARSPERCS